MHASNRGVVHLFLVIGFVLVVVIGAASYHAFNTKRDSAKDSSQYVSGELSSFEGEQLPNWKTYINEKHKYSFKYPGNFTVTDINPDILYVRPSAYNNNNGQLIINSKEYEHLSTEEIKNILNQPIDNKEIDAEGYLNLTRIENHLGYTAFKGYREGIPMRRFVIENNGHYYALDLQWGEAELGIDNIKAPIYEEDFNRILSSFHFWKDSKNEGKGSDSDWKKYINTKYSFELAYPDNGQTKFSENLQIAGRPYYRIQSYENLAKDRLLEPTEYYTEILVYDNSYEFRDKISCSGNTFSEYQKIQVGDYIGYQGKPADIQEGGPLFVLCVVTPEYNYWVSGRDGTQDEKIIKTILSTFRLTE